MLENIFEVEGVALAFPWVAEAICARRTDSLQVVAIETAVSETDIFAFLTGNFNIMSFLWTMKMNNCVMETPENLATRETWLAQWTSTA